MEKMESKYLDQVREPQDSWPQGVAPEGRAMALSKP